MRELVKVGAITGAHGVKGEVKLRSFTVEPSDIARYSPLETKSGGRIGIVRLRPEKDGFIAVLEGVTDRDRAEALKGAELFVRRARLPELGKGEIYLGDLTGLAVVSGATKLGEVVAVPHFGAGDLLEVKIEGRGDTVLIPFADGFVIGVDIAGGRIAVDLPEGFLEEDK